MRHSQPLPEEETVVEPVIRVANRRLTARAACALTVRYRVERTWHPATAMDVSRSGCRIRLGEDLARGAAVELWLEHTSGTAVEIVGRVVWSRLEGLSHQAGIHFAAAPAALDGLLQP